MKDIKTAASGCCGSAFEIAIKNCILPSRKAGSRQRVNISEADSRALFDFYLKNVNGDREAAMAQIALSSRRAAARPMTVSVITFVLVLCVTVAILFKNAWFPIFAALTAALAAYLYIVRRRTAQKIWASRKAFPRGTEEALEKMCLVLASNPLLCASKPVAFGLAAAVLVSLIRILMVLIK